MYISIMCIVHAYTYIRRYCRQKFQDRKLLQFLWIFDGTVKVFLISIYNSCFISYLAELHRLYSKIAKGIPTLQVNVINLTAKHLHTYQ